MKVTWDKWGIELSIELTYCFGLTWAWLLGLTIYVVIFK